MIISVGARTDTGTRDNNEDSYAVLTNHQGNLCVDAVLIVADGMGGRAYGERASSTAVETVRATLSELLSVSAAENPPIQDALTTALRRANSQVYDMAAENPGRQPMGTTCTTAVVAGDKLFVGHVGDSRAYLLRDDILRPITSDHSFVAEQMRAGQLSDHDARRSRFKNVITKAVGIEPTLQPDIGLHALKDGDVILVCTDGLTGMIDEAGITQILFQSKDPQLACDYLVEAAKRAGGKDNISALVAFVGQPVFTPIMQKPSPAPDRNGISEVKTARTRPPRAPREAAASGQESPASPNAVAGESASARTERFLSEEAGNGRPSRPAIPLQAVFFVAGVIIGIAALGIALVSAHVVRTVGHAPYFAPYERHPVAPAPVDLATVNYAAPAPLLYKPLRPGFLEPAAGGFLVMTAEGQMLEVGETGQIVRSYPSALSGPPATTSAPASGQTAAAPAKLPPIEGIAADRQGDIYRSNSGKKTIAKFGPNGAFLRTIDSGELAGPGALAVADDGDIFVIDDGRLTLIKALPAPAPTAGAKPSP